MARAAAIAVLAVLAVHSGGPSPTAADAAPPAAPAASGIARVNDRPLELAHAYLFHAPDNWDAEVTASIALLTVEPLDLEALRRAGTLREALLLAPVRVVVEARPDRPSAELSICHPELGGLCYSTSVSEGDWVPAEAAPGHFAGSVKTFTGKEETVFEKYRLFYEFRFDAAPVRDFERRR